MKITYANIKHLLKDWELTTFIDIEDLDYLDEYLKEHNVKSYISLISLGHLYNRFSEEVWASSWEDNAEGQFIEWLKENAYVQEKEKVLLDMFGKIVNLKRV